MDDLARIWDKFREGDQEAFASLFESLSEPLYRYGMKFIADPGQVEDCIQDVFLKLHRNRASLPAVENPRFYLMRALKNRIIDQIKKQRPEELVSASELPFIAAYEMPEEGDGRHSEQFARLLASLSPRQKEAIYLRFQQEMSYEEVSSLLGITYQSARNLVHRAVEKIRAEMDLAVFLLLFAKYFS